MKTVLPISDIKILNDSIKSAEYYSDGGAYIRLDLKKKYYEDQIVNIDFSFTQTHIYTLDGNYVEYSFIPGWFDEIEVKNITVKWNKANVLKTGGDPVLEGEYYVWTGSLAMGERLNTSVYYNLDTFEVSEEGQVQEDEGKGCEAHR